MLCANWVSLTEYVLFYKVTSCVIQFDRTTLHAAMAKRFATDAAFQISSDAMQILGGYGYLTDYSVERYFRDLRVLPILEGTNEIMRLIINRELQVSQE